MVAELENQVEENIVEAEIDPEPLQDPLIVQHEAELEGRPPLLGTSSPIPGTSSQFLVFSKSGAYYYYTSLPCTYWRKKGFILWELSKETA